MGKQLKIMHVLNSGDYSGAESVVITIIENYDKNMHGIYAGLSGEIGELLAEKEIEYYPVRKLNLRNLNMAVRNIKPDIIHAHDFRASCLAALTLRKIPIISHLHNNPLWIQKKCLYSFAYYMLSFRFKKILAVSSCIMDEYCFGKRLAKKETVIGNPVNTAKIRHLSECKINIHNNQESDVVFLGRFDSQKNPFLFLDIICVLRKRKPDIQAVMIGDGVLRDKIESEIYRRGMEKIVRMTGFLDNPYPVLKQTKILCMPSDWEGFGLAAAEALALGKPVVCSGKGGLKDIVANECGCVCAEKKDYVNEILRLLTDEKYYLDKSVEAYRRADMLNNVPEYMKKLEQIYRQILFSNGKRLRTVR